MLLRRAGGREQPHGVRLWGIGNETWGPWEAGHAGAETYARTLANWARMLKFYDPAAEVVAVGSAQARDPDWDRVVLDVAGEHLDHLSLHVYGARSDHWVEQEYLPVVCTPVGEIPHVLTDGVDARFVQPGDAPGIAAALAEVLQGGELAERLARNGRAVYEQRFSLDRFAANIARIHQRHFGTSAVPPQRQQQAERHA